MVQRHLSTALARAATALAAALALGLAAAPGASAANARVAISDYQWSKPDVQVDLGEHVTWYWTGPDTMHSVTGTSPNDIGWDSENGNPTPRHDVGDSFSFEFDQPGTYTFQCKLHSSVRGTIEVSANPGDPVTEPDPVPPNNVDVTNPKMTETSLAADEFGSKGTTLHVALNEKANLDAEFWRLRNHGPREYGGWQEWQGHIGYNNEPFGDHTKHFRPRPGSYVALLRATDASHNSGKAARLRFRIR